VVDGPDENNHHRGSAEQRYPRDDHTTAASSRRGGSGVGPHRTRRRRAARIARRLGRVGRVRQGGDCLYLEPTPQSPVLLSGNPARGEVVVEVSELAEQ
jgi:hypothetical protein